MELISIGKAARAAAETLAANTNLRVTALDNIANDIIRDADVILRENALDLDAARAAGLSDAMLDRLTLTLPRLEAIAASVRKVRALPDVLGRGDTWVRPNGLIIRRISVPLGVVGIIYEARPNVTVDAAVLCLMSGNAVILRGGKEAIRTNLALEKSIASALEESGLPRTCAQVIPDTSRETAAAFMKLNGYVDVLIPRGGKGLIRSVVENATVPVIETGAGNCHIYVDASANLSMALDILDNAKTQRPSVCNAAENLLVHESIANEFLPMMYERLTAKRVELRGCDRTRAIIPAIAAATEEDFFTEYNDFILSVKVVADVKEATRHINIHGTKHSEAIITEDRQCAAYFTSHIDAAAVYVNASTRFTDGEEFGFGAEIGIATQKLHARGPMGLEALTTIKYIVEGNGQIRK